MANIYLSSTFEDLKECREEVSKTLRQMGHKVVGMEDYTADTRAPLEKCLDDVSECDIYIGIFAWRYGSIPKKRNPQKKSITVLEYDEALRRHKKTLIFVLDKRAKWPGDRHAEDEEERRRIIALRDKLLTDKTVKSFYECQDLATQVSVAVARLFPVIKKDGAEEEHAANTEATQDAAQVLTGIKKEAEEKEPAPPPWSWKRYALVALALAACVFLAYQIKIRYWPQPTTVQGPEEYPTERSYDFYLQEKDRLQDSWDFPEGQWSLEKGEGEGENAGALLVKGNQMGVPKDFGEKVYYNYRAVFKVRFKEGDKAAWVMRAQPDKQSGYLFELRKERGNLYIKGWVLTKNKLGPPLPGDKPLRFTECCNQTDGIYVVAEVVGHHFTYCFRLENDLGHRTSDGGRQDSTQFQDSSHPTFGWGIMGLLTTDNLTPPETNKAGLMKVEYLYLTPLPRTQSVTDPPHDRSSICDSG